MTTFTTHHKLINPPALLKVLRGLERIRTKSEETFIKEIELLKAKNDEDSIERLNFLGALFNEQDYSSQEINELLWLFELEQNPQLIKVINLEPLLVNNFSEYELAPLIKAVAEEVNYKYDTIFIERFEQKVAYLLQDSVHTILAPILFKWESLFPKSLCYIEEELQQGNIQLSDNFVLIPAQSDQTALVKATDIKPISQERFEHYQRTSGDALTKYDILKFEVQCYSDRDWELAVQKLNWFIWVFDFFMTYHNLQATLLPNNTKRSPIKHIFSVKGEHILRHPLNTSNVFPFHKSSDNFSVLTTDPLFSFMLDRYEKEECEIRGKFFNGLHFFSKALREDDDIQNVSMLRICHRSNLQCE
ncbi:hypothetical protein HG263_14205 [Pseudoalteromonas sp. JBTF-M23]|uniref:Uncharacterized protein n=1 Tax=Pseudoalteromonas caenipelagi TaxID=2726988 RepID=A0A849VEV5_9GAMM|nr:hypothetical protein [Pseudoalteromonas caenipelagi]NOU51685.1 hypothetical protein [Pseudoalteromonas caenipelagi]